MADWSLAPRRLAALATWLHILRRLGVFVFFVNFLVDPGVQGIPYILSAPGGGAVRCSDVGDSAPMNPNSVSFFQTSGVKLAGSFL